MSFGFGFGCGNPVAAAKTLLDMALGKTPFDGSKAILAALEIAQSTISIFSPPQNTFTPMSIDTTETSVDNRTKAIQALTMIIPPEERPEGFTPKFVFPTDLVVRVVLVWVLERSLEFIGELIAKKLRDRDESKQPVSELDEPKVL